MNRNEEIRRILDRFNEPDYRVKQVFHALYKEFNPKYYDISTLSKELRNEIISSLGDTVLTLKNVGSVSDEQVEKILFETKDGNRIETVRMLFEPTDERNFYHTSLCVSSQSGCALGCKFCATGAIGFKKDLETDEIVDQIMYFRQKSMPVRSVSFMGMGEPFANPNLWEALHILTDPDMIGTSRHKISISTVGIIPGIEKLISDFPQVNLAFSLHTPFSEQRMELMPVTKAYPVQEVLKTINDYVKKTNNKVFIAYALMEDVNDTFDHAEELCRLIKAQGDKWYLYHVNLIRFNPGPGYERFKRPGTNRVNKFKEYIEKQGINVTIRQSFGSDIYAACGQLYGNYSERISDNEQVH